MLVQIQWIEVMGAAIFIFKSSILGFAHELNSPSRVELGCGSHKREGFFGIDIQAGPTVDLVLDIERQRLPFPDDSVDHVYSSHTFEHLAAPGSPIQTLREIMRVTKHGGLVEI